MDTKTHFVFLMHPKEFKREKAGTGRLTHLCLARSEIQVGVEFDQHARVQTLIQDAENFPVLVYPGLSARNLSSGELLASELNGRRLVVFLLDATWSGARKMLRLSPSLQKLPRVMFTPSSPSRFVIKRQPQAGCLSTLEATHELLAALSRSHLDDYPDQQQLLDLFGRMQAFQIKCAADPLRGGYRHRPYKNPELIQTGETASTRRRLYIKDPFPEV